MKLQRLSFRWFIISMIALFNASLPLCLGLNCSQCFYDTNPSSSWATSFNETLSNSPACISEPPPATLCTLKYSRRQSDHIVNDPHYRQYFFRSRGFRAACHLEIVTMNSEIVAVERSCHPWTDAPITCDFKERIVGRFAFHSVECLCTVDNCNGMALRNATVEPQVERHGQHYVRAYNVSLLEESSGCDGLKNKNCFKLQTMIVLVTIFAFM